MKEYFEQVNRMTAVLIYVPKILRKDIPTIKISSGTRLKTNEPKH